MLAKVLKIYHINETKTCQVEMSNAKVVLANIANRVPDTYNTNEGWVVKKTKKMKLKYANMIFAIFPIFYQKDKVPYFSNKFAMMISKANHGEFVN